MKKLLNEFKNFISKGNVLDLAVGVIIGSAFSKIVTSLVNDILMPMIGIVIGGLDFTKLVIKFKKATINYGMFIQNIIDFLLMAFCIFIFVKIINSFKDKFIKEKEEKKTIDKQEQLLSEIRDLLKEKNDKNNKK